MKLRQIGLIMALLMTLMGCETRPTLEKNHVVVVVNEAHHNRETIKGLIKAIEEDAILVVTDDRDVYRVHLNRATFDKGVSNTLYIGNEVLLGYSKEAVTSDALVIEGKMFFKNASEKREKLQGKIVSIGEDFMVLEKEAGVTYQVSLNEQTLFEQGVSEDIGLGHHMILLVNESALNDPSSRLEKVIVIENEQM